MACDDEGRRGNDDMPFLIIGLGSMGKRRIRNLLANGERDIVGFDPAEARRKEAEEKHGIKTVADLSTLAPDAYDVIIISTPPNLHAPYLRKALDEKKHFFVEVTTSDDGYAEAIAAPKDDGIVRAPSCTYRFYAPIREMKRLIESGRIGKVLSYQHHMGQYLPDWHPWEDYRQVYFAKRETGAVREMFPFEQIWLSWLAGAPVETASGWIGKVSALEMDADDCLSATLRYANGVVGSTLVEVISRQPTRRVRLLGTEGTLEWELGASALKLYYAKTKETLALPIDPGTAEAGYVSAEDMYVEEMKTFLEAVRGNAPWPYAFEDDQKNLQALYDVEAMSLAKTLKL
jgi:predicted dehydrogenase